MSRGKPLFTVPIGTKGEVEVTSPVDKVYVVAFGSPPDNRLVTDFCEAIVLALDILETKYQHGVVITTSLIDKFYSNGLDLEHAMQPGFFANVLYKLWRRILIYPMPTIALINGHGFAGALMTAMMHDYRIMNATKGFVCLNEVDLGVPLRPAMSSVFRQKCSPTVYRTLVLEGKRFKSVDALKDNIIDGLGGIDEVLKFIEELKLTSKPDKGVVGELKREMWRETVDFLENDEREAGRLGKASDRLAAEAAEREKKVEAWSAKAKL
ncbi:enoyl-CoA hydratase/isomerase [Karstenula rhodostoma CBS 690.94]|uniref:Enoyl-CoA hydratase/isomerase n=1 Tax=Karstenula rhodostoma CBS 690.94 TaxID=1392251 RepID=A0A9P4P4S9_9PLEO|nr:enoyl-CoA hydratase/isomerase [Karstenula rhodostoma CBS 690.94]